MNGLGFADFHRQYIANAPLRRLTLRRRHLCLCRSLLLLLVVGILQPKQDGRNAIINLHILCCCILGGTAVQQPRCVVENTQHCCRQFGDFVARQGVGAGLKQLLCCRRARVQVLG